MPLRQTILQYFDCIRAIAYVYKRPFSKAGLNREERKKLHKFSDNVSSQPTVIPKRYFSELGSNRQAYKIVAFPAACCRLPRN